MVLLTIALQQSTPLSAGQAGSGAGRKLQEGPQPPVAEVAAASCSVCWELLGGMHSLWLLSKQALRFGSVSIAFHL